MADPLFSPAQGLASAGNNVRRVTKLAELVNAELGKQLAALDCGIAAADFEVMGRSAHTIKGHAALFGCESLRLMALEAESAAKLGKLDDVRGLRDRLAGAIQEFQQELSQVDWQEIGKAPPQQSRE